MRTAIQIRRETICLCFLTIFLVAGSAFAQKLSRGAQTRSVAEQLQAVEDEIQMLKSQEKPANINLARSAVRQLRSILDSDPNSFYRARIEEDLGYLNETLALHELLLASFYMARPHSPR